MTFRVSCMHQQTSFVLNLLLSKPDAPIQCIARVRYDEDTICEYKFTYDSEENGETDIIIGETTCPPVNVAAYGIIGIIILTFLIGLIIILAVKINIYIADKREFAKFEEERKMQNVTNENPIYKSPVSIFYNPQITTSEESQNVFELK